jgi:SAM-dependent methyltransferase
MERELANARGEVGQEPFFIIDSPTFSKDANKEEVLHELAGDKVGRAVTIDDFAHNLESVPTDFCDYVFAVNVFQHMLSQDIPKALQEIVRVLAPGGKAVIVPLYEPIVAEQDVPGNRPGGMPDRHIPSLERFGFPQLDLLRVDLHDLPRQVDVPIKIRREEIPFSAFMVAQGGDPQRTPTYTPYTVVIEKLPQKK